MTVEYNLYRAKFIRPKQQSLFHDDRSPEEILMDTIKDKPSAEFRKNYIWHIGNLTMLAGNSGYFAIGRTTKTTLSKFDNLAKNFVEEPSETSPFTYVVFDAHLGLLAIAKKAILAQTTTSIASVIKKLLGKTRPVMANNIEVVIDIIPDPSGFIDKIRSVYALKGFTASFTGPNPFDADEYFQKPLSVYLNQANGDHGKASINGYDLDRDVVESVARSTASTGNDASAKVIVDCGERVTRINMKGDLVKLLYDEENHNVADVYSDMASSLSGSATQMKMIIIDTIDQLLCELNSLPNSFIFRGHSDAAWKLETTLERVIARKYDKHTADKYEKYSLQVFKSKFHLYDNVNIIPNSKLAWLSIMQHYGVPTRLLDFTESPYVALYFALEGYDANRPTDLSIHALDYSQLMKESLSYISAKDCSFKETTYTVSERQDEIFETIVDRFSYDIAWITEPHELNVRLDRQSGCFLVSGNKEMKIEDILSQDIYEGCIFTKYHISNKLYEGIYALLRKMNINSKTIYGDLQGLALSIKMEMAAHS